MLALANSGTVHLVTAPHVFSETRRLIPRIAATAHTTIGAAEHALEMQLDSIEVRQPPARTAADVVRRMAIADKDDAPLAALVVATRTAWFLSDDKVFVRAGLPPAHERELLPLLQTVSGADGSVVAITMAATILWHLGRAFPEVAVLGLALGLALMQHDRTGDVVRRVSKGFLDVLAQRERALQQARTLRSGFAPYDVE